MEEYADLADDEQVKRGLVAVADSCYRTSKTEHAWSHDYCLFRAYATAYRYTGDPKYLGYLRESVVEAWPTQKHIVNPDRSQWRGRDLRVLTSKTGIASFAMTTLPYALWALAREDKE